MGKDKLYIGLKMLQNINDFINASVSTSPSTCYTLNFYSIRTVPRWTISPTDNSPRIFSRQTVPQMDNGQLLEQKFPWAVPRMTFSHRYEFSKKDIFKVNLI